ncbi:hypothetical protein IKF28_02270 [Candidatus Saccharibacteria bacterium]|nr:hypothetical protein [Candidatus Saccharibacteria bacterium]
MDILISSTSVDEKTGTAQIVIEGEFPTQKECDDPLVEIFRSVRKNYKEIFFIILTTHGSDNKTMCVLYPSNKHNRCLNDLLEVALKTLRGDDKKDGLLSEYAKALEAFFDEDNGYKTYLEDIRKANETSNMANECNDHIKAFIKNYGLEVASMKPKAKKTRAQKKAESEAYLASHPEISKK